MVLSFNRYQHIELLQDPREGVTIDIDSSIAMELSAPNCMNGWRRWVYYSIMLLLSIQIMLRILLGH